MKRVIRASLSPSMPSWLKKKMMSRWGSSLKNAFLKKGVALDRAEFKNHAEQPYDKPIYLLQTDYGEEVYVPGFNDEDTTLINGRNRKFGSIAKSKLADMTIDMVYIDLTSDSGNIVEKKERYRDPRYTYRYSDKGDYAGQYMTRRYLGHDENGESIYEDTGWSETGKIPSNESRARDKSGYKIPSPEARILQFYDKFPERISDKVGDLYDRLIEVRQELLAADFDSPVGYEEDKFQRAFRTFSEALHDYRRLLDSLDQNRKLKGRYGSDIDSYVISEFAKTVRSIQSDLDEVEKLIDIETLIG